MLAGEWPPDKAQVFELLKRVNPLLNSEPSLIRVNSRKVVFIGDTHGNFDSSRSVFDRFDSKQYVLVFLGDYVDRGPQQLRNIYLLLMKKLESPDRVVLLRGNHETWRINRIYGFLYELLQLYEEKDAYNVWNKFNEIFSLMPYGCLVNGKILAIHGGLPSGLTSLKQIGSLPKGETDPTDTIAFQLLWNDPDEGVKGFAPSPRGKEVMLFGREPVESFEKKNRISLIIARACISYLRLPECKCMIGSICANNE